MMPISPLQLSCSRPLYEMLSDAIQGGGKLMDWLFCNYTINGLGLTGFGLFLIFIVAIGLQQWTEGFTVPAVWMALTGGVLVTFIPGMLVARIFGVLVLGVAMLFWGLWYYLDN